MIPSKRVSAEVMRDFSEDGSAARVFFDSLRANALDCFRSGDKVASDNIWKLYDYVASLDITTRDLFIATDPAWLLSKMIDKLMPDSQEALCEMPEMFYKHQNTNGDIQDRSKSMLYNIADKLGGVTSDEAQKLFFKSVNGLGPLTDEGGFLANVVKNIGDNFGKVPVVSQNSCISLIGNGATQCAHMPQIAQQNFSRGVAEMLRSTRFPYKFDKDSLREALFRMPDYLMSKELDSAIEDFDSNVSADV